MDLFKILTLILFIVLFYKNFIMNNTEGFESTAPSLIDDWNAVNQLAQISKKLMAGGLTIPGTLSATSLTSTNLTTTNLVATNISLNGNDLQKSLTDKFTAFENKLNTAISEANTKITNGLAVALKNDDSVRLYVTKNDWALVNGSSGLPTMYGNPIGVHAAYNINATAGYGSTFKISRS